MEDEGWGRLRNFSYWVTLAWARRAVHAYIYTRMAHVVIHVFVHVMIHVFIHVFIHVVIHVVVGLGLGLLVPVKNWFCYWIGCLRIHVSGGVGGVQCSGNRVFFNWLHSCSLRLRLGICTGWVLNNVNSLPLCWQGRQAIVFSLECLSIEEWRGWKRWPAERGRKGGTVIMYIYNLRYWKMHGGSHATDYAGMDGGLQTPHEKRAPRRPIIHCWN